MALQDKAHIDSLVEQWLAVDINEALRAEIQRLHSEGNYSVLAAKMTPRIAFGTAGLRASMQLGFAHMNDVTVLQASQGLVSYILQHTPASAASLVVGYDHRHHSQRYAEITASVAVARGVKVYYLGSVDTLSEELTENADTKPPGTAAGAPDRLYVHTPLVPFGIDHFGAAGGVMVTASHNPARDNGYKVYYGNGCQIIPPHDAAIAQSIDANLAPWSDRNVWDIRGNFAAAVRRGLLVPAKHMLSQIYVDAVLARLAGDRKVSFGFVYTPMHGVGGEIFGRVCGEMGVRFDTVREQADPDPDFPTVRFPNPEEHGALDLAMARAQAQGLRLVVATDPDADRFAVAVQTRAGAWRQLTGNEVGTLFAAYVVEELVRKDQLARTCLVCSTVSSQMLRAMAAAAGCRFQDTLTGFKWIGNEAIALKAAGYAVPFGYEEAIGYMFLLVNDKDGISACVVWMRLYERWFASGSTDPLEKLERLYATYGWFKECNGYYKLDDVATTARIFDGQIRASYDATCDYPRTLGAFSVLEWRDLTVGFDSSTPDRRPVLPTDASAQMITAVLRLAGAPGEPDGDTVRFTCRGSGTEPKLKVYIEGLSRASGERALALARKCWDTLREEWFKPAENGLEEVL
ncbi:Phosphoglucomutase/phosphomannomutase [Metschnikowia bicuspidata var. bicuspidata NRRL YB-4993]|uniref:Phosphoglucomutase/phosphomannomutase n=1 Tax=Metschnikowia bicuspidata var. bicuspidata NRRL YB-4993 TaxID=869754 RepID=A0A1A0HF37_9ASCO|nr:Phosphoglucomutase/phosphomannomutase [Metschnikowia bicuspidata var. bicuspidata NRRL YB-4993]OBA22595.1 Phosphoglucomutase/phosphomannomutase [Metschnikowia bicuspidata var. bicuspidata NRRL YB-4993]